MQFNLLAIAGIVYLLLMIVAIIFYLLVSLEQSESFPDKPLGKLAKEPFVSIIVPTYNEESNIEACLRSLCSLDYSNYEIIVSDGGSSDRTVELAKQFTDKIIVDKSLPEDWIGKSWGCHLASQIAKGEILLFTDADTIHKPESLKITVSILLEKNAALVSMLPYQKLEKWWESLVPIFFFFSHLCAGGWRSVNNPKKRKNFVAIGQYLLFTRSDYDKIGGHVRVKGSIIEDLAFARVVKTQLGNLYMMDSRKLVSARMYPDSPKQCWTGWKKTLYAGTKLTPPSRITSSVAFLLWGIFSPVAITLAAIYSSWPFILLTSLSYVLCSFIIWTYWRGRGRQYWVTYLFFPLWFLIFAITVASSAAELVFSKTTTWRGRTYYPDLSSGLNNYYDSENYGTTVLGQLVTDIEIEMTLPLDSPPSILEKSPQSRPGKQPLPITSTEKRDIKSVDSQPSFQSRSVTK